MVWRKSCKLALVDLLIDRFQLAREAAGLEQGREVALAQQMLPYVLQLRGLRRQRNSQHFILGKTVRDQFTKVHGLQKTRCHP